MKTNWICCGQSLFRDLAIGVMSYMQFCDFCKTAYSNREVYLVYWRKFGTKIQAFLTEKEAMDYIAKDEDCGELGIYKVKLFTYEEHNLTSEFLKKIK